MVACKETDMYLFYLLVVIAAHSLVDHLNNLAETKVTL
jgi:hypothetical protein